MSNYYKPINFRTEELVDENIFKLLGERSLELCFDSRILWQIDTIRLYFNKSITINNWHSGGTFKYRGFRPFDTSTGAKFSQHKFGRAIDFDVKDLNAEEVRQEIIKNQHKDCFKYISRIEDVVKWVHIDIANTNYNGILLFKP